MQTPTRPRSWFLAYLIAAMFGSWLLLGVESPWRALWPSVVGLLGVWLFQRVVFSLLIGAFAGGILLMHGNPLAALVALPGEHLAPAFRSSWNVGAIVFSLLLGGFAALIEGGGGLRSFVIQFLVPTRHRGRNLQLATVALGFTCFFDGLANALLIGRVTRSLAPSCGVSPAKMAYIADSTSSTVASIAFVSTWVATQLSLIQESLNTMGLHDRFAPTDLFFQAIPTNFYVWATLALLIVTIWTRWDIGPMARAEAEAQQALTEGGELPTSARAPAPVWTALVPLALLVVGIIGSFYLFDARPLWPVTATKLGAAFSSKWQALPLVLGTLPGLLAAWALYPRRAGEDGPLRIFLAGARQMVQPMMILFAAWTIGSVIEDLHAAEAVAQLLQGHLSAERLPLLVFLAGAAISFSTGSSWGTMALLMPLALPMVLLVPEGGHLALPALLTAVIGAVFGGAVFGDHCSPFSDTTVMSSIACGVAPAEHVRTQLPYALIAATLAILAGYLPLGQGWLSSGACLGLQAAIISALPLLFRRRRAAQMA